MAKINQKGFGHLGLVLGLVVLAVIGAVGWYVYDRNNGEEISSFEECVAAGNPVAESYPEQCSADGQTFTRRLSAEEKKKVNPDTTDWQTYDGQGFSLSFPADWRQFKPQMGTDMDANFVSKDFKEATDLGPSVLAGYWLEVFAFNIKAGEDGSVAPASYSSYDEHLNYLKTEEQGCGGDYRTSTIDGLPAIISTIKCHGSYITAYVYKNDTEFMFRLNSLDEDKPQNVKLFENILSTVVLD